MQAVINCQNQKYSKLLSAIIYTVLYLGHIMVSIIKKASL